MKNNVLVIVESPTKAKTIRKFLPKNFKVLASMGHVRDLPQSASEIPASLKKEAWAKIGVNVEQDFEPLYVVPKGKSKIIKELKDELKEASELYLATDEDREGESISWHLIQILKPKIPVKRMVFHEITKEAITEALEHCRDLNTGLVQAQETRRILDRLVGYSLSPLLWKKIAYGLSAGRVQSAGLRLIVDRERARRAFRKASYWDLKALLSKSSSSFEAHLSAFQGKRIANGKDFDEKTGRLATDAYLIDEKKAHELQESLKKAQWKIGSVEEKLVTSKPLPPFITSTLQQEANRKLSLSARDTMRVAQRLYEEGLITYMRTDSPFLSQEGLSGARANISSLFGQEYLSPEPRQYISKSKMAQEAHEAIRPAGSPFIHPKDTGLGGREFDLYDLIWKRTVASQMTDAKKNQMRVEIKAGDCLFVANGLRIVFPGFLRAYVEGSDDPEAELENRDVILPPLKTDDVVTLSNLDPEKHETQPPARYTEASLVQALEAEGIGRPSTYASIIDTVINRGYVKKIGKALVPTFTGIGVVQFLERHFSNLVDYKFTSQMEEALDEIADGKREYLPYLKDFYLAKDGLQTQITKKEKSIDAKSSRKVDFDLASDLEVRIGRYGPYLVKTGSDDEENTHVSLPEDLPPADLDAEKIAELIENYQKGPTTLGLDPKTNKQIYVLTGRFGPYVQLGEISEEEKKPKRASIPKEMNFKTVTLEQAISLLSFPRQLGTHPQSGKPILANFGRFGPYVQCGDDFRSIKKEDNVLTITLERALELLAQEKKAGRGKKVLKELGQDPEGSKVTIYSGIYGPYVKRGATNVSLPKDVKVEDVTLEQALVLLSTKKTKKKKS